MLRGFPGQRPEDPPVIELEMRSWVLEHCADVRDAIELDFGLEKAEENNQRENDENDERIKPYRREVYMRFPDGHTVRQKVGTQHGGVLNSPIIAPLFHTRIERSMNVLCVGKLQRTRRRSGYGDDECEQRREPAVPIIFNKSSRSIIGHGECIRCPDPDELTTASITKAKLD